MSYCLDLTGSVQCPDFAGYTALIPGSISDQVQDVTSFDDYMSLSFDLNSDPGSFGTSMRSSTVYDCPNWDGTGLRYYKSSWCMYFIASGITTVADSTNATCSTAASAPLCLTTWNKFESSWTSTLSSAKFCPSGESDVAQTLTSLYSGLDGVMSTATTCIVSLSSEAANCGFHTAAEASAFCSATTVAAESCCSTVTVVAKTTAAAVAAITSNAVSASAASSFKTAIVASSSAAAAAVSAAAASSGSSGVMSIPVIAGAAGGVAALLIIAGIIFYCVRRKKRQNEAADKDISTAYGMNKMSSDRQPFSNQGASIGYSNPPVNRMGPRDHQMCEAVYDYTANLPDELTAVAGDKVILKIEYDDGWGFGYNTRTKKEGTVPLDILDKFQNGDHGYNDNDRTTRVSSMYGPGGNNYTNNGPNSVYYAQSEYNTNSIYAPGGAGGSSMHEAAYDFTPEQPDEIELRVGDRVELQQQYDDGWALGRNLEINREGLFPLDCLAGFDGPQQFDAQGKKKHNNRVSSMYGTESHYGAQSMYGGNSSYYGGGTESYYEGNGQDSVYYG